MRPPLSFYGSIANTNDLIADFQMKYFIAEPVRKKPSRLGVMLQISVSVNGYLMSSGSVIYGIGIEKGNYSYPYLDSP